MTPTPARWPGRMKLSTAAEYLDVSDSYIRKLINAGQLRAHQDRPGGDSFISREECDRHIRAREEAGVRAKVAA